jgi:L-ribulokinase
MPIKVARSDQAVALGAAMFASVAAGIYKKVEEAQKAMGSGFEKIYSPDSASVSIYSDLYKNYSKLAEFIERERP